VQRIHFDPSTTEAWQHWEPLLLDVFPPRAAAFQDDIPPASVITDSSLTMFCGSVPELTEVTISTPQQQNSEMLGWQQTGRELVPSATLRSIPQSQAQETWLFWSGSLLGTGFAFFIWGADIYPYRARKRREG
jgi:hypothetical protein